MKQGDWVRVIKTGLTNSSFQIESVDKVVIQLYKKKDLTNIDLK